LRFLAVGGGETAGEPVGEAEARKAVEEEEEAMEEEPGPVDERAFVDPVVGVVAEPVAVEPVGEPVDEPVDEEEEEKDGLLKSERDRGRIYI
jgi:hypothetical protein